MSSKREEERNEKIIRGLMKLPPNRRCINCDAVGPQYVCTNFWTFVCTTCSGIHREFTHRVKSVSMSKFTSQEVQALQKLGNQHAREIYLKNWDFQRQRFPNNSKPDRIREFIKHVYVDRRYATDKNLDKPPRNTQDSRIYEDETRRASSYHSYSQSPPYDHEYEERRYGKQFRNLTRMPGSDHGHYDSNMFRFAYSPGQTWEQMHEDRCASEGSGSRASDFSFSGESFRSGVQSPNLSDPNLSDQSMKKKDMIVKDGGVPTISSCTTESITKCTNKILQSQNSMPSGSLMSSTLSSLPLKSVNSCSLADVLESERFIALSKSTAVGVVSQDFFTSAPEAKADVLESEKSGALCPSTSVGLVDQDSFVFAHGTKAASSSDSLVDLFADVNHQPANDTTLVTSSCLPIGPSVSNSHLALPFMHCSASYGQSPAEPFVNSTLQQESTNFEQKLSLVSSTEGGWATFDIPLMGREASESHSEHASATTSMNGMSVSEMHKSNEASSNESCFVADQSSEPADMFPPKLDSTSLQFWNTFDSPHENSLQAEKVTCKEGSSVQSRSILPEWHHIYHGNKDICKFEVLKSNAGCLDAGGVPSQDQNLKSMNPFDGSYGSIVEFNSGLVDMNSCMPLPEPSRDGLLGFGSHPWLSLNSSQSYGSNNGAPPNMSGQAQTSELQWELSLQGSSAPFQGNPFA